MILCRWG